MTARDGQQPCTEAGTAAAGIEVLHAVQVQLPCLAAQLCSRALIASRLAGDQAARRAVQGRAIAGRCADQRSALLASRCVDALPTSQWCLEDAPHIHIVCMYGVTQSMIHVFVACRE